MKRNFVKLAFAVFPAVLSVSVLAQDKNDQRFDGVDNLLKSIMSANDIDGKSAKTAVIKPKLTPDPIKPTQLVVAEPTDDSKQNQLKKSEESPSIMTLPPYTRFELVTDVIIPAYHMGVMYTDGALAYNVKEDASAIDILHDSVSDNSCILKSSKNYVVMRGAGFDREPTYLDVQAISIIEQTNDVDTALFSQITFFPKSAKSGLEESIEISLICRIPTELATNPTNYKVKNLKFSVGDLFEVSLPKFIEI
jgi:hypothetical protein